MSKRLQPPPPPPPPPPHDTDQYDDDLFAFERTSHKLVLLLTMALFNVVPGMIYLVAGRAAPLALCWIIFGCTILPISLLAGYFEIGVALFLVGWSCTYVEHCVWTVRRWRRLRREFAARRLVDGI